MLLDFTVGGRRFTEARKTDWPEKEYVATSWAIVGFTGRRIGTQYIYEHDVHKRINEKGFRWRPKYLKHLREMESKAEAGR